MILGRWKPERRAVRRASIAGVIAVALILDSVLPIYAYRAYCPGTRIWVDGPFRERFLSLVSEDLWRFDLDHFTLQGNIYEYGWGGTELYWELFGKSGDYHLNMDWKFATGAGGGMRFDGGWLPPPPRVVELVRAKGPDYQLAIRHDARGLYLYDKAIDFPDSPQFKGKDPFRDDCELFKAAILPDSAFVGSSVDAERAP